MLIKQQAGLFLAVLICLEVFSGAFAAQDNYDGGLNSAEELDQAEASQFLKRLFHPFSTKNEEIKRETVEVYEEKCESIVPGQR